AERGVAARASTRYVEAAGAGSTVRPVRPLPLSKPPPAARSPTPPTRRRDRRRHQRTERCAVVNKLAAVCIIPLALAACAAGGPSTAAHPTERTDPVLTARIRELVQSFGGDVGIYVRHLPSGATATHRADELFPTASLIKVPLLTTLFDRAGHGLLDLDAAPPFPDTLKYRYAERTDVVAYMQPGDTLPLSELAFLMLSVSDNLASLWIQALVGGGEEV